MSITDIIKSFKAGFYEIKYLNTFDDKQLKSNVLKNKELARFYRNNGTRAERFAVDLGNIVNFKNYFEIISYAGSSSK